MAKRTWSDSAAATSADTAVCLDISLRELADKTGPDTGSSKWERENRLSSAKHHGRRVQRRYCSSDLTQDQGVCSMSETQGETETYRACSLARHVGDAQSEI
ncbi:hypothetical protein FGADI_514 [Fusarium gaditjirri]|uniref:Uncharacterized protein n=1 Tax=Fusarium gaditjirri TaxID=282569 RepID=A0A8H4X405_9HYPO|nr:hypothetical protein FGADI_514 [Fusarium gaditjirri]